jgi:glycosyltransferase involved in cell wall biosynthesis
LPALREAEKTLTSSDRSRALRVALLVYRGNPRSGGQGVYVRHLSEELVSLGHHVTVFAGRPYPELADDVVLERLPSLDLYRDVDPFRVPHLREIEHTDDLLELATMFTGGFGEPRAFARRAREALRTRIGEFDLVHDDQGLGRGLLGMIADGWPVIASIHHPVTIDRSIDLAEARSDAKRRSIRRWYGFSTMQRRVARRLDRIITVSETSKRDIEREMGLGPSRVGVVPIGVDQTVYAPTPGTSRVAGRIMTTASADVALKGLGHLLEAVGKLRTERPETHLVVIGTLRKGSVADQTISTLGLESAVEFVSGPTDAEIARRYAEASVAVVPSLYEGFSLPAIEAMSCGTPLVATTGGALPEVVGDDGATAVLVPPGDASALAAGVGRIFDDPAAAAAIAERGRLRVVQRFSWRMTAERTVEEYRRILDATQC